VTTLLRQADVSDIEAMHRIRLSVRENALSDPRRVQPADYRPLVEQGGAFVCEREGNIVAFGVADALRRNIWALFVEPGREGDGMGRRLLDAMTAWLFAQSPEPIWLTTGAATRAERFYRAAGWHEAAREPNGELRFELSPPRSDR
jgi:GNAT superfamily N-acetyltransferase